MNLKQTIRRFMNAFLDPNTENVPKGETSITKEDLHRAVTRIAEAIEAIKPKKENAWKTPQGWSATAAFLSLATAITMGLFAYKSQQAAQRSANAAQQALENSFIPWIAVERISFRTEGNLRFLDITVKNHSSSPALRIKIILTSGNMTMFPPQAVVVAMPHSEDVTVFWLPTETLAGPIIKSFLDGEAPLTVELQYFDRYDNFYSMQQTVQNFEGKGFKQISYRQKEFKAPNKLQKDASFGH